MLLTAGVCRLLNSLHILSYRGTDSHVTRANVVVGFFVITVRWLAGALDFLNAHLKGTPVRLRRLRVESVKVSCRLALPPIRIHVARPDVVLCLHRGLPGRDDSREAWKSDILFLDAVVRLARRNSFLSHVRRSPGGDDAVTPQTRTRAMDRFLKRLVYLAHWLVRVELTDVACRFEDAIPLPFYRNVPGFGFAITVLCEAMTFSAVRESETSLATGGFHACLRVQGLKGYFDPGVEKLPSGAVSSVVPPIPHNEGRDEEMSVADRLPPRVSPIIYTTSFEAFLRADNDPWQLALRVVFVDELTISLSDLDFQSGIAAILRIPLFFSTKIARGGAEDLSLGQPDRADLLSRFDTSAREKYCRAYADAFNCRFQGRSARVLADLELPMSLDEALCLRQFAESLDLRQLWSSFDHERYGWQGCESVMSRLLMQFDKEFQVSEAGLAGAAANDFGVSDAEVANPELVLKFDFRVVTVLLRSSVPSQTTESRVPPEIRCDMKNAHIDVYDALSRTALVVSLVVGSLVAKGSDGYYILRGIPSSEAELLLMMRFREDGLLSPSQSSVKFSMSSVDVFAVTEKLRFILKFFIPRESPHSFSIRRPVEKTIAVARRDRAKKSNIVLPLRCVEHPAIADVRILDVTCHLAESHVDSAFFVANRESRWRLESGSSVRAPLTNTIVAHIEALFIHSCRPPTHKLDSEESFVVDVSPVGIEMEDILPKDPSILGEMPPEFENQHDCYEAYEQISALQLEIRGIHMDLIIREAHGRAEQEGILQAACIACTFVYVGLPFSSAFRFDSYLDVDFGPTDARIRAESAPALVSLFSCAISPVLELVEDLGSCVYPLHGFTAAAFDGKVMDSSYADDLEFPLVKVMSWGRILRSVRRVIGDLHVHLRRTRFVFVHSSSDGGWIPGSSSQPGGRAFMEVSLGDSFVRMTSFSSLSYILRVTANELAWEISRGPSSVRRAFIPGLQAKTSLFNVAQAPWHDDRPPESAMHVSLDTLAIKIMAQTASLVTVEDLRKLILAMSPSREPAQPSLEVASRTSSNVSEGSLSGRDMDRRSSLPSAALDDGQFVLKTLSAECFEAGLAITSEGIQFLRAVEPGAGVAMDWKLVSSKNESSIWKHLRVHTHTGFAQSSLFLCEDVNHHVQLEKEVPKSTRAATWRFFGRNKQHIALQCGSGRFLGFEQDSLRCVTSSVATYFRAEEPGASDYTEGKRGGFQFRLAIPALSLHFGGGGGAPEHTMHCTGIAALPPGVLQLDVDEIGGTGTYLKDEGTLSSRVWGKLALVYNNMTGLPFLRLPVLQRWPFMVSLRGDTRHPVVVVHGDGIRLLVSNTVILKILSALRNHEDVVGEEDMSYFSFTNLTDRDVGFQVLGHDLSSSVAGDGPLLYVKSLQRVPFQLPSSLQEPRESSESAHSKGKRYIVSRNGNSHRPRRIRSEDHTCKIIVSEEFHHARVSFGSVRTEEIKLDRVDEKPGGMSERSLIFHLRVTEDEKRGSIRLELVSPIGICNRTPVSIDLWKSVNGEEPCSPWLRVPRMSEISVSCADTNAFVSVRISETAVGKRIRLRQLLSNPVSSVTLAVDSDGGHGTADLSDIMREYCDSFQYFSPIRGMPARLLLTSRDDSSRRLLTVAPLMVIQNSLLSIIDIWIDDGISVPTRGAGTHQIPRWVTAHLRSSVAPYGRQFLVYAFNVRPGVNVPILNTSTRGEYRFQLREPGGLWTEPVSFAIPLTPFAGRQIFHTTVSIERGLLDISGVFDDNCSLRLRISSRFVIWNRVPGLVVSLNSTTTRISGNPAPARVASKALTIGLGRHNYRRNIFDITAGNFIYFNESEAYVGVRDQWSKKILRFPETEGDSQLVKLSSIPSPGGIQLVVEAWRGNELRIHPLVELKNDLDVPVEVDSSPGTYPVPVRVAPSLGAPFHQPHNILDSILTSTKLKVVVSSRRTFLKSGPIHLEETGTHSLSVRRQGEGSGASALLLSDRRMPTNTAFIIIGVDVFVDEASGRQAVRFLSHPRYGPAFQVVNYSKHTVLLSDDIFAPEPLCRARGKGRISSFAWSSVLPSRLSRRRVIYASIYSRHTGTRGMIREIRVPNPRDKEGTTGTRSDSDDVIVTFDVKPQPQPGSGASGGVVEVSLGFRFQPGNGFMGILYIYDPVRRVAFENDLLSLQQSGRITRSDDSALKSARSLHVVLPRLDVQLKSGEANLCRASFVGLYGYVCRTKQRLKLGCDLFRVELRNLNPRPAQELVLMRATGGRNVDERSPCLSLSTTSRLPHTQLNPSDLLHFEVVSLKMQPFVAKLDAKFVDQVGMYFVRTLDNAFKIYDESSSDGSQLSVGIESGDMDEALTETLSMWRMPLHFDRCEISSLIVNLSFSPNGFMQFASARDDQFKSLTAAMRDLVLRVLPPIKDAQLKLSPPKLSNSTYLSGELGRTLISNLGDQSRRILRSILGNVKVLEVIETLVLGKKKGKHNQRRLRRALAFASRSRTRWRRDVDAEIDENGTQEVLVIEGNELWSPMAAEPAVADGEKVLVDWIPPREQAGNALTNTGVFASSDSAPRMPAHAPVHM